MDDKRSYSIDFIKGIAAISIVCLHCENNDAVDSLIHLVGRMAVPMFFIITGYYLPSMIKSGSLGRHICKLLRILIGGLLFYLSLYCIEAAIHGVFWDRLFQIVQWRKLWECLLLARIPLNIGAGHLWYLLAILYILLFVLFFTRKSQLRSLFFLIPILFLVGYLISSFDVDYSLRPYYQNYLFIGLPYVLLGSCIFEGSWPKMTNKRLGLWIALSAVAYLAEIVLYVIIGLPSHREHYLAIIPLVSFILIWAAGNPQFGRNSFISRIGRKYSIYIYVVQFYIAAKLWTPFHGSSLNSKIQMLLSVALSILVSYIFVIVKQKVFGYGKDRKRGRVFTNS